MSRESVDELGQIQMPKCKTYKSPRYTQIELKEPVEISSSLSINGGISNQAAMNANYEIEQQSDTSTNVLQFIQKKVAKKTFNIGKVLIVD